MSNETEIDSAGIYETKRETTVNDEALVKRWKDEWELASKREEGWRKEADAARNVFRAEKEAEKQRFNILFSNVQTRVTALYNSTPVPDVRARFNDRDEKSRLVAQTIERCLSYSLDSYDFDATMKAVVQDSDLAGRGAARVRYMPYEHQGQVYEEVGCEHVLWKHLRLGPANRWADMPWIGFELFLTRDQLMQLAPKIGGGINLDVAMMEPAEVKPDISPNVFRRAHVWEIWDKQTREVLFIAPGYDAGPLRREPDPLQLMDFYPMPEPLYAVRTADSMVPICPFRIIKPLADELEEVTKRIQALIKILKWRGVRHPSIPSFELLEDAADGELVAATEDILQLVQGGGLEKFIYLMPIQEVIAVVQQLYVQREQIKQTIFEVSGLSDILRGQTDPNETLGAQEIKANFGNMRLEDQKNDVQKFARNTMRLKAEIICTHFSPENIAMMSGMQQPTRQQVQQAQQAMQILQSRQQQAALPPPPIPPTPPMMPNGGPPGPMMPPEQAPPPNGMMMQ